VSRAIRWRVERLSSCSSTSASLLSLTRTLTNALLIHLVDRIGCILRGIPLGLIVASVPIVGLAQVGDLLPGQRSKHLVRSLVAVWDPAPSLRAVGRAAGGA